MTARDLGGDLRRRLDALEAAVAAARGRLDDELLDAVEASAARSTDRFRLSASHTIVAIAGATGSGKSTTFNALAGVDLSVSGAQRPTTSTVKALVWSDEDIEEALDWLGVQEADRHHRPSLAQCPPRSRLPEGLVLLDLPDHDSVQVAHHREAERIVDLADVLIWVVDPQKYADAAIHQRFLRPLAGHRDVLMVVLNHIDAVPEELRQTMLRDVRAVLASDGIRDARILATSARDGTGIDELRTAIRRRLEEKPSVTLRVEADLRTAAARLDAAAGRAPISVPDVWVDDLERRVADAAGVPALAARSERVIREEVSRRASWPMRRRPDAGGPTVGAGDLRLGPIDRPAVDTAVRTTSDQVCRDLPDGWGGPIRAAATERLAQTDERLDAELAALRLPVGLPRWLAWLGPMRGLLAASLLGGLLVLGAPALLALAVALVVGVGVAVFGKVVAARIAARHGRAVEDACRRTIARVLRRHVVVPIDAELTSYALFRRRLDAASARPTRTSSGPRASS